MREILQELERLVAGLDAERRGRYMEPLLRIKQRVLYPDLKLALIGNFSCGKSTFLNAVLKRPLLTMDALPTTAIPTNIDWNERGGAARITVTDMDGRDHVLDQEGREWFRRTAGRPLPEQEGRMIDALTTDSGLDAVIKRVRISFPEQGGFKGFCIVDTPGINPGDEAAKGHILQTQDVLRKDADAAIVLFPSYCVYTHEFSEFLEQNAKHLLADSVFVVTKMDLAPEKEREKLIRFVKGRLESEFGLERAEVYGCAAALALEDYSRNRGEKSAWTMAFEQMLREVFGSLGTRRKRLVTSKTEEMLKGLFSEMKNEIETEQGNLLLARKSLDTYSYENLQKEYERLMKGLSEGWARIARRSKDDLADKVREKVQESREEAGATIRSKSKTDDINDYLNGKFKEEMETLSRSIEALYQQAGTAMNRFMEAGYKSFCKETGELLERYRYNAGQFRDFMEEKQKNRENGSAISQKNIEAVGTSGLWADGMLGLDSFLVWGWLVAGLNVVGLLIGAAARLWFWKKREEAAAGVEQRLSEYEESVVKQCRENLNHLWRNYRKAAETLLKEYQDEYESYFENQKRELAIYRKNVEGRIGENEETIKALDRIGRKLDEYKSAV